MGNDDLASTRVEQSAGGAAETSIEDLANTPAERAAASKLVGRKGGSSVGLAEEKFCWADAEECVVGASSDGQHMVVVGAGLVGALCAVVLRQKGFTVEVFERYSDIRSIPSVGRSINLSVTSRGLRAIKALGGNVYTDVLEKLSAKVHGRIIHMPEVDARFQRYGRDDSECNYSISRVDLNKYLIDMAAQQGAVFHFNHRLSETSDFGTGGDTGSVLHFVRTFPHKEPSMLRVKVSCPIIACDGAGSRVRYALRRGGFTTFTEDVIPTGYKEVLFPYPGEANFAAMGEDGSEPCSSHCGFHIWPRGDHMMIASANLDGSFTGTLFLANKGAKESFEAFDDSSTGRQRCSAFCKKYYADAALVVGGVEEMVRQIVTNPTGVLGTVSTTTWAVRGKVLLIGDACHAMVPFFGQGCNCGFEDVLWLSKLLDRHCCRDGRVTAERCIGENFAACFAAVEAERKPNADAICAMALENLNELRDKTGDARFQAIKRLENKLEKLFPDSFRSRYAMVSYGGDGNVSYANAKRLGILQWELLEELYRDLEDPAALAKESDTVDLSRAKLLLEERLLPVQKALRVDLSTVRH